jgi:hypothetical protein
VKAFVLFSSILTLSCPPTSHTVKLMFLYSTVSTLKPVKERGERVCMCVSGRAVREGRERETSAEEWQMVGSKPQWTM